MKSFGVCCCFRYLGTKLYNYTFPRWKDANKDVMITFGFQHKVLGQTIPESFSHNDIVVFVHLFMLWANFNKWVTASIKNT